MSDQTIVIKDELYTITKNNDNGTTLVKSPMRTVCVHLPQGIIKFIEDEIKLGNYSSKADIMRYALRLLRDKFLE